jgi:hypothetical protein
MYNTFRYGQDEIEQLLVAAGAKEHVEPPKKISVVGRYTVSFSGGIHQIYHPYHN